jgi:hypothetical protein
VQSLTVRLYGYDWSDNPLRPAFLHLLHFPTLTHFRVFTSNKFVASDLSPCINLKKLEFGHYTIGAVENNTFSAAFPDC